MVYLNIEDTKLLTKIITYLDYMNIKYTFSLKDDIDYILISSINRKNVYLMDKYKVIYIAYNDENNIINNIDKYKVLDKCYKVIVSIEYIKSILKKHIKTEIEVIHKEIPLIKYTKKDTKILKNKYIVINDFNLDNLNIIHSLTNTFDYKYYLIGFNKLSKNNNEIYNNLSNKVVKVKYIDYDIYKDLVRNSYMVIDMNDSIDLKYIQIPILYKKTIIIKDIPYYDKYLISNKDVYMYGSERDLLIKIKKIIQNRLSNLTDDVYYKIIEDTFKNIAVKYSQIFK